MKIKRMFVLGFILWLAIFIELTILMFTPLTKFTQNIIHYVLLFFFSLIIAHLYYQTGDRENGFFIGFFMAIEGVILDCIITVPLIVKSYSVFFSNPHLYPGLLGIIIITAFYKIFKFKEKADDEKDMPHLLGS